MIEIQQADMHRNFYAVIERVIPILSKELRGAQNTCNLYKARKDSHWNMLNSLRIKEDEGKNLFYAKRIYLS